MNVPKLKRLVRLEEWAFLEEYPREVEAQSLADLEEAASLPESLEHRGRARLARHLLALPRLLATDEENVTTTTTPSFDDDGM